MTLGKYIQRLTDKLDVRKQWERKKAAENARKARPNQPIPPMPWQRSPLTVQTSRYGFAWWTRRRHGGLKTTQGKLLPRTDKSL